MQAFKNDEDGYLEWHAEHPNAFVLNHFGGTNPAFNVLHLSKCTFLWRPVDDGVRTVVEKWCSNSESEIEQHADATLGPRMWKKCRVCFRTPQVDVLPAPLFQSDVVEQEVHEYSVWIPGEPSVWIGSGEKEWKKKVTAALQRQAFGDNPQWIDVEFRLLQDRLYTKDIDNLLTPILESGRDAGWVERGFANLGSVTARKVGVTNAEMVGAFVTPHQQPPPLAAHRTGVLVEAPLASVDADAVKWTLYNKSFELYEHRPELRYPPQRPIAAEIRVMISNAGRRKSLQALMKPCIDGLEPLLGHPDNLLPEPRESLHRRLAPQDEMILTLELHVRGGNSNEVSVLLK
jgi:hypothetical protein